MRTTPAACSRAACWGCRNSTPVTPPRPIVTFRAVHATLSKKFGDRHQGTVSTLALVGLAQFHAGRQQDAEQSFRVALRLARQTGDERDASVQKFRYHLALCLLAQARAAEAAPLVAGLDPVALGPAEQTADWPSRLALLNARIALAQGDRTAAGALLEQARATLTEPRRWRLDRLPEQIESARRPDRTPESLGGDATLRQGPFRGTRTLSFEMDVGRIGEVR